MYYMIFFGSLVISCIFCVFDMYVYLEEKMKLLIVILLSFVKLFYLEIERF